jgi:MYXO-CTERM domain-containing protein
MKMREAKAKAWVLTAAVAVAALQARDASACGGCFVTPTENTQITGEQMLLTISQQQTTLYDAITYSGNPSSFAWVLPIKGLATVGLSSDALFQNLAVDTGVTVIAPSLNCDPGNCYNDFGGSSGAGGSSAGGPVTVVSQEVVGPYETVQLQSTDPMALRDWLAMHGYNVPAADGPVIDAYVAEGFNFLALKLVPGQAVSAMRPVRVTTPGATPTLPLRMVAVGSGAITPITLWVIAEGRYETTNLPSFQIDPAALVWDWDTQSSNYKTLKQDIFTKSNNKGWVVEAAEPFSMFTIQGQLSYLVETDPVASGYADAMGMNADKNFADDMTALFAGIPDGSVWITRFEGQLSRAALATDLQIGASADQTPVNRFFQVTNTTGVTPVCPPPVICDYGSTSTSGGVGGSGGGSSGGGSTGCNVTNGDTSTPFLSGAALVAALALTRRRRAARAARLAR